MTTLTQVMTPPQLAARWGVKPDKVLELIRRGELRAINLATDAKGQRPRWKILISEVERFEEARSSKPPAPKPQRRRRQQITEKHYFRDNPTG